MKSRSVIAVSAATLLAAGVISASTATASHSPHKAPAFELTARALGTTFLDLNKKANQGDTFDFTENLFFKGTGRVGHDFGACTVINKHAAQCVVTLTFDVAAAQGPTSSLTVQGITDDRHADDEFAVTGGTGGFEGANGEVDVFTVSNTKSILEFDFINGVMTKVFG
jgi:Dirigent-like protein